MSIIICTDIPHTQYTHRYGDDFVEWKEFRLLLVYLRRYCKLHVMYIMLDTDGDHRVSFPKFKQGVMLLKEWGCDVDNPAAAFAHLDADSGRQILFNEFCDWALVMHLNLEVEGTADNNEDAQIE